jgi:hypothetical protein
LSILNFLGLYCLDRKKSSDVANFSGKPPNSSKRSLRVSIKAPTANGLKYFSTLFNILKTLNPKNRIVRLKVNVKKSYES